MNEKTNPNESWTLPSAMTYKTPTKTTITRFDVRNIIYCAAWLSVIAMLLLYFLGVVEQNAAKWAIIIFMVAIGMFNYPVSISTKNTKPDFDPPSSPPKISAPPPPPGYSHKG